MQERFGPVNTMDSPPFKLSLLLPFPFTLFHYPLFLSISPLSSAQCFPPSIAPLPDTTPSLRFSATPGVTFVVVKPIKEFIYLACLEQMLFIASCSCDSSRAAFQVDANLQSITNTYRNKESINKKSIFIFSPRDPLDCLANAVRCDEMIENMIFRAYFLIWNFTFHYFPFLNKFVVAGFGSQY